MPHGLIELQDVNVSVFRESWRNKVLETFTNAVRKGQITPEALSNLLEKQEGYAARGLGPIAFDLCSNGRLRPEFRGAIMSLLVREGDRVTLRQEAGTAVSGGSGPILAAR